MHRASLLSGPRATGPQPPAQAKPDTDKSMDLRCRDRDEDMIRDGEREAAGRSGGGGGVRTATRDTRSGLELLTPAMWPHAFPYKSTLAAQRGTAGLGAGL